MRKWALLFVSLVLAWSYGYVCNNVESLIYKLVYGIFVVVAIAGFVALGMICDNKDVY